MIMELILEVRDQGNETAVIGDSASAVALTPLPGEDYWSHRVRLSDTQAVLGFPKFSTIGIGFAVEEADWNTNLPFHCPTDQILDHILDNKGDEEIADADVREAIRMIQLAVIDGRVAARQEIFSRAGAAGRAEAPVTVALFGHVLDELQAAMQEGAMLRAEVDHLRAVPVPEVVTEAFPGASPIPDGTRGFVTLLLRLGVPTKDNWVLDCNGKWEMPQDTPISSLVDEASGHPLSEVVGRIVGLWPFDGDIYAVGVAGPELAEDLNMGRLVLRADLSTEAYIRSDDEPRRLSVNAGRVTGAMVGRPEDFAWATN
jgi:hypothetical protein